MTTKKANEQQDENKGGHRFRDFTGVNLTEELCLIYGDRSRSQEDGRKSFPETVEQPHFEKTSFREEEDLHDDGRGNHVVVIKLSPEDQSVFSRSPR